MRLARPRREHLVRSFLQEGSIVCASCFPAAASPAFRSWLAASAIAWTVLIPYCSLGLY
jgi:hypothetical protein